MSHKTDHRNAGRRRLAVTGASQPLPALAPARPPAQVANGSLEGEENSNRNNITFKNGPNRLKTNEITFSNRNKNSCWGSRYVRPASSGPYGSLLVQ